jgi:3-deoxy-D-manno-octulosonate 8-phosphate phosphatase (KDO 8-P phosphatase)
MVQEFMVQGSVEKRAARVRLVLFDVDGVLTDGRVVLHGDGTESKQFHIRDGIVIVWAQRVGLKVGLLSARLSATTTERAAQLGITLVHQGVTSKIDAYDKIVDTIGLDDEEVAYMGDDIVDIAVLSRVGLAAAPADAVAEVRERVHWVAPSVGGAGAAREFLELILRAQGRWDAIVRSFTSVASGAERA